SLTPRGGSGRTILLIDIPGEFLTSLVEGNNDTEIPLALVAALALSDRLILTLPSDVCVIGPLLQCEHREAGSPDERLERANAILAQKTDKMWDERAALAGRLKALRAIGVETAQDMDRLSAAGLTGDTNKDHIRQLAAAHAAGVESGEHLTRLFADRQAGTASDEDLQKLAAVQAAGFVSGEQWTQLFAACQAGGASKEDVRRLAVAYAAGVENGEQWTALSAAFRDISISLSEKLIREQWVKLDVFRERVSNALGRAAHVVHKHGRNTFLDKPANTWLEGYSQAAAERLPPIHGGSLAVLTKADRVLPLLTDRDFGVKPGRDWPHLPERQANRDALQASGWRSALARHIGDPRLVLAMTLPKLVSQLDGWLPNMRYEWASAEWQASGWSVNMDLSHDHRGVRELAHWIARGGPDRTIAPAVLARIETMRAYLEGRESAGGKSR
ncbi:MAG TPA: hypothetical protein VFV30_03470, partial [Novosphingobium sp.]|nr:hypothetical protein [Novosphingobium sp.]